ncbi:MAG TPA: amino acid-binding protein [Phycisphaerae bacterium]|nr:amino acid-binding protein [Phycisphaerae bacterium]HUU22373.1 amino acid-binding protein [Phycisphaerae bacterium]
MAMKVSKVQMWVTGVQDVPGALAAKLHALAEAGASLEFVLARRTPEKKGEGVVFLIPLKGARQLAAARKNRVRKSKSIHAIRVEGPDKRGMGARISGALAEAGINMRGLSALVLGRKFVLYLALDSAADAAQAARVLGKI